MDAETLQEFNWARPNLEHQDKSGHLNKNRLFNTSLQ